MGTLRMPTIPGLAGGFARGNWPEVAPQAAAEALARLFSDKNAVVLTGAGVSVDSGIRAYRGESRSFPVKCNRFDHPCP